MNRTSRTYVWDHYEVEVEVEEGDSTYDVLAEAIRYARSRARKGRGIWAAAIRQKVSNTATVMVVRKRKVI